jgi:hypothetical protein
LLGRVTSPFETHTSPRNASRPARHRRHSTPPYEAIVGAIDTHGTRSGPNGVRQTAQAPACCSEFCRPRPGMQGFVNKRGAEIVRKSSGCKWASAGFFSENSPYMEHRRSRGSIDRRSEEDTRLFEAAPADGSLAKSNSCISTLGIHGTRRRSHPVMSDYRCLTRAMEIPAHNLRKYRTTRRGWAPCAAVARS